MEDLAQQVMGAEDQSCKSAKIAISVRGLCICSVFSPLSLFYAEHNTTWLYIQSVLYTLSLNTECPRLLLL